jgi:pimeloyl-ACP methyl ester carboxylesterase
MNDSFRNADNAAGTSPAGRFVEVESVRLHYVEQGAGQPVVFLHGGILSSGDYAAVLELAAPGFRAIAFDRPGYGRSERPSGRTVTPADQARLLRGALRKLGAEQPILVGHSWSGALVLAYALAYPADVSGLVLLAPGAYGGEAYPAGKADYAIARAVRVPFLGRLLFALLFRPLGCLAMKPMLRATFAPDPVPPGYAESAKALWLRFGQFRANREDVAAFEPAVDALCSRYGEIRLPAAVVIGDSDPFHPDLQARRLHREIPDAEWIELPGTGHMLPLTRPDAVVDAVRRIAARVSARTLPANP